MKFIRLLYIIFLIANLCVFGYLYFSKTSHVTLENQFGTFSISSKGYQTASGKSVSGYGLCHCNEDISDMNVELDKDNMSRFRSYITENKYTVLSHSLDEIAEGLGERDYTGYQKQSS